MKKSKLLKITHPELIKEWDFEKNIYSWDTISTGSGKRVWWKCEKGHSWDTRVYVRTGKDGGTGCRYCKHNSPPRSDHNFAVMYPHLLEEWDYDKNDIDPHLVSPKSCTPRWWKCKYGHSWKTRVAHRANGHGCSDCNKQTSRLQIYIYCEMKYFFPNAQYRHKINRLECDVYLPDEKIGIEVDGNYWHDNRADKDAQKVSKLRDSGIEVISIREYKHPMVNRLTIGYHDESNPIEITKELAIMLGRMLNRQDLTDYSKGNEQINKLEYLTQISKYPMSFSKSLAEDNPELAAEWDYEANGKLTPEHVAPYSHTEVGWICSKGHKWPAAINNRNQLNQRCPWCANHYSVKRLKQSEAQCPKIPLE